ncbi:uncharacterized protein LOC111254825 [Varroa destructor]|uniref:Uncharacterized protein n=1 Tax=Varroa destructor TaxID=109461 RepID=A0A7M7KWE3_VARDE|nr:uncharacterized protein LOC111254825 [Varroa destructor]XP_022671811.1 uncharacterized protein LOC111254825 [Varroa destructor]
MSSSCTAITSDSFDELFQTKSKSTWSKLLSCCCWFPQRRKNVRVVPILKTPKLRQVIVSENVSRQDKVQIRMSLVEERSLTPITTDTAYAKPPIHKRRKLIAAAHEFSELMTFNRIEVDTEPIITSKSKRNAVRFQLCRLRKSAGERRRHEQELSNRLAALELRLRDIDDEVISSSESNRRPDERKFGARADHKVPRMATREIERRSLRKPKEICAIDRSTIELVPRTELH